MRRTAGATVALLMALALAGCKQTMHAKLSEQDANEMVALLMQAGVDASKAPAGDSAWRVEVPSAAFADAVQLLKEHGLPRPAYANIGQIFKREGLVSTPNEERIRFVYAQQQELENTLSRLPGVVSARVHVVHPQQDPLSDKPKRSSASVVLIHRRDADLASSVPQIKALVGHSIEGLGHEQVSMSLFAATEPTVPTLRAGPVASLTNPPQAMQLGGWAAAAFALGAVGTWGAMRWGPSRMSGSAGSPGSHGSATPRRAVRASANDEPGGAPRGLGRTGALERDGGQR